MQKNKFKDKVKRWTGNFLLLLFSVILTVVAAEVILRFTPHSRIFIKYPTDYVRHDTLAGYDLVEDYPPVLSRYLEYDCTIWTNGLGCFDRPYEGEKDYILLVGDSFSFGHAPFEHKFGTLTEKYLDYRVLKCGVGGYGTLQELLKIKKIVQRTHATPQLIILGYWMGDDLRNDLECLRQGLLPADTKDAEASDIQAKSSSLQPAYSVTNPSFPLKVKLKNWIRDHSLLYHLLNKNVIVRKIGQRFGLIDVVGDNLGFVPIKRYPWLEPAWKFHLQNLKLIKELSDSYKARLLVVLIPVDFQVYDFLRPSGDFDFTQPNRILGDFFNEQGIEYLDLTLLFRQFVSQKPRLLINNENDLYWRHDIHLNNKGNKLAGLLITGYIIDHNLIKITHKLQRKAGIEKELDLFPSE